MEHNKNTKFREGLAPRVARAPEIVRSITNKVSIVEEKMGKLAVTKKEWVESGSARRTAGFTLIEILVVVAIIGILASIVLVGLGGARRQGGDAKRIAELRQIQTGLELYFTKCGYYPGGTVGGACNTTNPTNWANLQQALTDANIGVNSVPNDPAAPNKSYGYAVDGTRQRYVLAASLSSHNSALDSDFDDPLTGFTTTGAFGCGDASPDFMYCIAP